MRYLKLFEKFDMEKVMKMSKEKLSEDNQKTFDKLTSLFGISPTHMKTSAKNLKYIPYKYSGKDEDILTVFDLDLNACDLDRAIDYIQSPVSRQSIYIPGLSLRYTITIFIADNGKVIFRFIPNHNQNEPNKELQEPYTKEFNNVDEMFSFITAQRLPEMLSDEKYREDKSKYKQELYRLKRKEDDEHYDQMRSAWRRINET